MKHIKIMGKYHKVVLTVIGKINLTSSVKASTKTYILTDDEAELIDAKLQKGEDLKYINGQCYAVVIKGSEFEAAIQELKYQSYMAHKQKLNIIKKAYSAAHTMAVMLKNGFIRVLTHIKHSFKVAFEKLFVFDVRTNSITNL